MKKILFAFLLISTSFYAQNYEKNWNTVIENENNGKIKSANTVVAKIHKKAVADKNEVQIIKCFFLRIEIFAGGGRKCSNQNHQQFKGRNQLKLRFLQKRF